MLFRNMITAKPVEIIPVAHLVFHFGLTVFAFIHPYTIIVPPCLCRSDITNQVFSFDIIRDKNSGNDVVSLLLHSVFFVLLFLRHANTLLYSCRISSYRFFHKYMLALFDGFFKMNGPETREVLSVSPHQQEELLSGKHQSP